MTDEKLLIAKAKKGDERAFEELVVSHQNKVYSLALRMVGNAEDACDVSQEVFIKVYHSLPGFREEASFSTWLYRICSNVCIDFLRRQKRHQCVSLSGVMEDEDQDLEVPDTSLSPEVLAERIFTADEIKAAIRSLSPEHRIMITARDISGLSYEQISELYGIELGTVKSRINRARKKLKNILISSGNFFEHGPSNPNEEQKQKG